MALIAALAAVFSAIFHHDRVGPADVETFSRTFALALHTLWR